MLDQIRAQGYASVRLGSAQARILAELYERVTEFFAGDRSTKARHGVPNQTSGYRLPESAHAGDPDNPDVNESFLYWNPARARQLPGHPEIDTLLGAFEAFRQGVAVGVMDRLVAQLRAHYGYRPELPFQRASVLQSNSFTDPTERELLQTRHEDGVVATLIWTSAIGLEGFHNDTLIPLTPGPDELFVMPGGVLAAMTGGEIGAFYHQARNHRVAARKSIMYFSCFDVDRGPIEPFVVNDTNREVDIRDLITSSTDMFGLVEDFVIAPDGSERRA